MIFLLALALAWAQTADVMELPLTIEEEERRAEAFLSGRMDQLGIPHLHRFYPDFDIEEAKRRSDAFLTPLIKAVEERTVGFAI